MTRSTLPQAQHLTLERQPDGSVLFTHGFTFPDNDQQVQQYHDSAGRLRSAQVKWTGLAGVVLDASAMYDLKGNLIREDGRRDPEVTQPLLEFTRPLPPHALSIEPGGRRVLTPGGPPAKAAAEEKPAAPPEPEDQPVAAPVERSTPPSGAAAVAASSGSAASGQSSAPSTTSPVEAAAGRPVPPQEAVREDAQGVQQAGAETSAPSARPAPAGRHEATPPLGRPMSAGRPSVAPTSTPSPQVEPAATGAVSDQARLVVPNATVSKQVTVQASQADGSPRPRVVLAAPASRRAVHWMSVPASGTVVTRHVETAQTEDTLRAIREGLRAIYPAH